MIQSGVAWTYSLGPKGEELPYRVRCRDCGACLYFDSESRDLARAMMRKHVLRERRQNKAEQEIEQEITRAEARIEAGLARWAETGSSRRR